MEKKAIFNNNQSLLPKGNQALRSTPKMFWVPTVGHVHCNITLGLNPLRTSYDLQVIGKITHSTRDLTFQEKKNIVEEHAEYFNCDTV